MKRLIPLCLCALLAIGCNKNDKTFTLKTVKVNAYRISNYSGQNIFVKIIGPNGNVLRTTRAYPGNYTLPATFAVTPVLSMKLYKEPCVIQLWGDSAGLIGASTVHMDDYKIIFPIDMEAKGEAVSFNITGSWK